MLQSVFLTKLVTLGILISTLVWTVVVTKSVKLVILPLISFILVLRAVIVANLVILGFLSLNLLLLEYY